MITVLHAIETGGPGGAETVFCNIVTGLDPNRYRSIVLVPDDRWLNQTLRAKGVEAILWSSPRWPVQQMRRLIRSEHVQLIHSHLPDQNFFSALAGVVTGTAVIATYHGALDRRVKARMKLALVKRTGATAVGVSNDLKAALVASGFSASRVHCIHNGIPIGTIPIPVASSGHPIVGTIANLRQTKGYEYFLEAAQLISREIPNVRFMACGEKDDNIWPKLEKQMHQLGIADRVDFCGFRPDAVSLLSGFDVFVLASTHEGFSLVTVEAMAAARPVVVTRSGGPEEIVTAERTGLLVPPKDATALAAAVIRLLRDPELAARMGQAARTEVESRFSVARMVADYEQLYAQILEQRR